MAILKETNWYIRQSGDETNGGGYDGTNYPGGTNYADQDSPQLTITDLTSTASTTVTSALSTFTSDMVGNCLRLASGSGATTGYYFIASFISATSVTLDRVSGTYTAGVAKVGGAHATFINYSIGGTGATPAIVAPSPMAGNIVNIRGSGSNDPSPSSPDYTYGTGQYWEFNPGDNTSGHIRFIGYNGRPCIKCDLLLYQTDCCDVANIKFVTVTFPTYPVYGIFAAGTGRRAVNIIFDQNGEDSCLSSLTNGSLYQDVECRNSGGGAAGSTAGIGLGGYGNEMRNCWMHGLRGDGVNFSTDTPQGIQGCIIANNGRHGISVSYLTANYQFLDINNCTITNNGSDGINIDDAKALIGCHVTNNIISNNGGYGINVATGSASANDFFIQEMDYNNIYNNTSGARHNLNAGAHDTALDPQFTNAAGNDYSVGTNMKAIGRPAVNIGSTANPSSTRSYVDLGAAQRQEAGGGGVGPGMRRTVGTTLPVY